MTDEVIIKALRCASHIDNCPIDPCDDRCPYFVGDDVDVADEQYVWANGAADLIEQLSAKVDELERQMRDAAKGQLAIVQAAQADRDQWKQRAEELEEKLGGLLSHVTNGKFSKASYTLEEMKCFVNDHCDADCETTADRDRWKQRAEAAERDILNALKVQDECAFCVHRHECLDEECPGYICGVGATGENGEEYPDFRWDCRDFAYGDCPMLENTPCNGCDFKNHFKWRGPCPENSGGDANG